MQSVEERAVGRGWIRSRRVVASRVVGRERWRGVRALAFACSTAAAGMAHAQSPPGPTFEHPPQAPSVVGRRLAIVVGIDSYARSPLLNARNDARAMASALRELGFAVTHLEDVSRGQMVGTVAAFSDQLRPDDVAFFFYAGHGLQVDGENYLVPADFDAASPTAVRLGTLPVSELQAALGRARVSVLVLDACRNNPFASMRGGRGLAPVEARGSLIAFATGAGQTAGDNPSAGNGLFTQQLLATLREPGLPLRDVFYRVRQRVHEATNGQQFPALYDGLLGDLVLRLAPGGVAPPGAWAASAAPPPAAVDFSSAAAAPSANSFELRHWKKSGSHFFGLPKHFPKKQLHPGVLRTAAGRVQWSESHESSTTDDFNVACRDVERVKEYYGAVQVRVNDRDFLLIQPDGDGDVRAAETIAAAVRAVCPEVASK